jgi:hypothetical protein
MRIYRPGSESGDIVPGIEQKLEELWILDRALVFCGCSPAIHIDISPPYNSARIHKSEKCRVWEKSANIIPTGSVKCSHIRSADGRAR